MVIARGNVARDVICGMEVPKHGLKVMLQAVVETDAVRLVQQVEVPRRERRAAATASRAWRRLIGMIDCRQLRAALCHNPHGRQRENTNGEGRAGRVVDNDFRGR